MAALRDRTPVMSPLGVAVAPLSGLVTGVLAGLYPAWPASRTQPAQAHPQGAAGCGQECWSADFVRSRAVVGMVPSRPAWKSSKACWSSCRLFMTNGP